MILILLLNLSGKIVLKRKNRFIAFSNFDIYYIWTLGCFFIHTLAFDFLEEGLGIVSSPYFVYDFSRKMFLVLYSINWPNDIAWLHLILEILVNIRPGCIKILWMWLLHAFMKLIIFGVCLPRLSTGMLSHMQMCGCVWSWITGFPLAALEFHVSMILFCTPTHWPIFFLYVTLTPGTKAHQCLFSNLQKL